MKKYGLIILAAFIVFILQTTFAQIISIYGWTPDFLLILIFVVCLRYNTTLALVFSFFIGVMQDIFITDFFGISAFSNVIAAYVALFFRENKITLGVFTLGLLVVSFVKHFSFYFILTLGTDLQFWMFIYTIVLPQAIYTLVIGVLIFFVFNNLLLKEIRNEI